MSRTCPKYVETEENEDDRNITVAFLPHLKKELGDQTYIPPAELKTYSEGTGIKAHSYKHTGLSFEHQY